MCVCKTGFFHCGCGTVVFLPVLSLEDSMRETALHPLTLLLVALEWICAQNTHTTHISPAKNKQNAEDGPEFLRLAGLELTKVNVSIPGCGEGKAGGGHNCQMDGN